MLSIRGIWLDMKGILRETRQMINAGLEPLGLSGAEGDILFHLLTGSDGYPQERLARQLDIGKAAISRVIDALEQKGYVSRARSREDKRAYRVNLTEKGRSTGPEIRGVYERLYALVRQGIADEEFYRIESLLGRVAANLRAEGEEGC
jgi:DNA-binding MarR family transcriptional regulator